MKKSERERNVHTVKSRISFKQLLSWTVGTIQDKNIQDKWFSDFQMETLFMFKTFISRKFFVTSNHSSIFLSSCVPSPEVKTNLAIIL